MQINVYCAFRQRITFDLLEVERRKKNDYDQTGTYTMCIQAEIGTYTMCCVFKPKFAHTLCTN